MYTPSLEEVKKLADQGNLMPVYRSINADLETPVSAYLKVARPPYSFLLESVAGGERLGRYSFIGTDPYRVIKTGANQPEGPVDPLTLVQEELDKYRLIPIPDLPRFHGGAVGYLAYDTISYFEPRVRPMPADPQGLPESVFAFVDTLLVFDHLRHDIKVVSHVRVDGDIEGAYAEAVDKIDAMVQRLAQKRRALLEMTWVRPAPTSPRPSTKRRWPEASSTSTPVTASRWCFPNAFPAGPRPTLSRYTGPCAVSIPRPTCTT